MVQIAAAAHRAGRGGNLSNSIIKNPRPKDHALLLHLNAKLPKFCGGFLCINSCKWAKKILQTGKALGINHKEPFFAVARRRACRYGGLDFIRSCGGHGDKKAAFCFLRAEHGLFIKGNRSFVGSTRMSMRGNGEERKGAALFPGNSGGLLHQAADGLRVSGGVIHGRPSMSCACA